MTRLSLVVAVREAILKPEKYKIQYLDQILTLIRDVSPLESVAEKTVMASVGYELALLLSTAIGGETPDLPDFFQKLVSFEAGYQGEDAPILALSFLSWPKNYNQTDRQVKAWALESMAQIASSDLKAFSTRFTYPLAQKALVQLSYLDPRDFQDGDRLIQSVSDRLFSLIRAIFHDGKAHLPIHGRDTGLVLEHLDYKEGAHKAAFGPLIDTLLKNGATPIVPKRSYVPALEGEAIELSGSLQDMLQTVREAGFKRLIFLSPFTSFMGALLATNRCAPHQVSLLGFPLVTDQWCIDTYWGDREESENHKARVSWQYYPAPLPFGLAYDPQPLPDKGPIIVGVLANIYKITPSFLAMLAEVNARFKEKVEFRLYPRSGTREISFHQRHLPRFLKLYSAVPRKDYIERLKGCHFCITAFPFTALMSAAIALSLGRPVLTLMGTDIGGRALAAKMVHYGLGDFVAGSPQQYQAMICRALVSLLASDSYALKTVEDFAALFEAVPDFSDFDTGGVFERPANPALI